MLVQKTVKVPIHHATTKCKLHVLDRLTARLTHAVKLWSGLIELTLNIFSINEQNRVQGMAHKPLLEL